MVESKENYKSDVGVKRLRDQGKGSVFFFFCSYIIQ